MGSLVRAYLRIGAIIHRVTADLLYLQYKYARYAVDNNDFEDYPVICTNSQMRPFGNPAKSGHADIQGFK